MFFFSIFLTPAAAVFKALFLAAFLSISAFSF